MSDSYDPYVNMSQYAMDPQYQAPDPSQDPNFLAMLQMLVPQTAAPQFEVQAKPGGKQLPQDIGTYNQTGTAYYHDIQNLFAPELGMIGAAYGMPTYDPGAFVDQAPPVPKPVVYTPNLDAIKQDYPAIGQAIEQGSSIAHVSSLVRAMGLDDNETKDVIDAAKAAQKDVQDAVKSQNDYQSKVDSTPAKQTAMQKFAESAGLPDPLATYGPADITDFQEGPVATESRRNAEGIAARAQQMAREANKEKEQAYKNVSPSLAAVEFMKGLNRYAQGQAQQHQQLQKDNGPLHNPNLEAEGMLGSLVHGIGNLFHRASTGPNDIQASVAPNIGSTGRPVAQVQAQQQAKKQDAALTQRQLDAHVHQYNSAVSAADKKRQQAEALLKIAKQNQQDAERSVGARKQAEANRRTAAGRTPYNDAVKQREALYAYLRNGGSF